MRARISESYILGCLKSVEKNREPAKRSQTKQGSSHVAFWVEVWGSGCHKITSKFQSE